VTMKMISLHTIKFKCGQCNTVCGLSHNTLPYGLLFNPTPYVNETQISRWIMLILLIIREHLNTGKCQFMSTENGRYVTPTLKISPQFDLLLVLCQQMTQYPLQVHHC